MILVDRNRTQPPAVLSAAGGRGESESASAIESLEKWKGDKAKWTFTFSVYSDRQVKDALGALFHGKCAYCETSYGATQPMDVEHWRPKAQVEGAGGKVKPAYFWLASSWDNLLPSCIDCNRRRKQKDALTGAEVLLGKQDQFPLEDGSPRATAPGEENSEVPLLLNPCLDEPADFLRFTPEGVVKPLRSRGLTSRRARASVTTYALNRSGLVLARKEHLRGIKLRIARVRQLTQMLDQDLAEGMVLALEEMLLSELRELARMRRADQPYSQQARQLIDRWVADLKSQRIPGSALETPEVPGRAQ